MPRLSLLFALVAAALGASAPAQSQSLPAPDDETVQRIAGIVRANITRGRVSDGSFVPPETPQELARPIVAAELVRQTVTRGFLTGEMEACGLDWEEVSFLPYMAAVRAPRRYSDKQLVYIGMLHGFSQGLAVQAMAERATPCSEAKRQWLEQAVRAMTVTTP
jgi:hypothetical protein